MRTEQKEVEQVVPATAPKLIEILDAVCDVYRVNKTDIINHTRYLPYVEARMAFYWMAKRSTIRGYMYIARFLNGRDHTCAINGVKRVEEHFHKYEPGLSQVARKLGIAMPKGPAREGANG